MKWWNIWRKWLTNTEQEEYAVRSIIMPRLATQLQTYNSQLSEGQIRFGTPTDIECFITLEKEGYNGYLAWNQQDFAKDLRHNPYAVYLLLEVDNQVVAMISGRFTHRTAHISHLIVAQTYQRHGVGQQLLQLWLQLAQSQGILQASLEVRADNEAAQRVYQRHGFIITKTVSNYYGDGTSALQMRLNLPTERVRE